jgi:hypothetical protein
MSIDIGLNLFGKYEKSRSEAQARESGLRDDAPIGAQHSLDTDSDRSSDTLAGVPNLMVDRQQLEATLARNTHVF